RHYADLLPYGDVGRTTHLRAALAGTGAGKCSAGWSRLCAVKQTPEQLGNLLSAADSGAARTGGKTRAGLSAGVWLGAEYDSANFYRPQPENQCPETSAELGRASCRERA